METVLDASARLRTLGFTADLSAVPHGRLRCAACGAMVDAASCTVVDVVRFEGESNPDDEAILMSPSLVRPPRTVQLRLRANQRRFHRSAPSAPHPTRPAARRSTAVSTTETEPTDEGGDPPCWAHLYDTEDPDALVDDAALARLVRDLADAVVICDPDGTIRFWNTAATHIFGWTADEATGASLDLIIPERLRERHWAGYQRVMATGHTDYGGRPRSPRPAPRRPHALDRLHGVAPPALPRGRGHGDRRRDPRRHRALARAPTPAPGAERPDGRVQHRIEWLMASPPSQRHPAGPDGCGLTKPPAGPVTAASNRTPPPIP
jgi:PAS domain-containing protein